MGYFLCRLRMSEYDIKENAYFPAGPFEELSRGSC